MDPNKLHHIFDLARHKLDPLVREFGSQERAFEALQRSTQSAIEATGRAEGVFENLVVKVGASEVTVSGRVIDGIARIGTAFIP